MVPVPLAPAAAQAVSAAGNGATVLILLTGISSLLLISVVFAAHNGSYAPRASSPVFGASGYSAFLLFRHCAGCSVSASDFIRVPDRRKVIWCNFWVAALLYLLIFPQKSKLPSPPQMRRGRWSLCVIPRHSGRSDGRSRRAQRHRLRPDPRRPWSERQSPG